MCIYTHICKREEEFRYFYLMLLGEFVRIDIPLDNNVSIILDLLSWLLIIMCL